MKVADLKKALRGVKDDAELTVSVDVSTGQEDWEKRCFAGELIELQENSLDGMDVSLLTIGHIENAREAAALRDVLALSHRLRKTDPVNAAHLVRFCASAGVVPKITRKGDISGCDTTASEHVDEVGDERETIATAAVRADGVVHTVPRPGRHHTVLNALPNHIGRRAERDQGFVTSTGRFVDRIEGAAIALAAGQVIGRDSEGERTGPSDHLNWPPNLYSEDMW